MIRQHRPIGINKGHPYAASHSCIHPYHSCKQSTMHRLESILHHGDDMLAVKHCFFICILLARCCFSTVNSARTRPSSLLITLSCWYYIEMSMGIYRNSVVVLPLAAPKSRNLLQYENSENAHRISESIVACDPIVELPALTLSTFWTNAGDRKTVVGNISQEKR